HVQRRDGADAERSDAAIGHPPLGAARAVAGDPPVGLSAAEAIEPDPFARASAIGAWRNPPDFVSVNVGEVGWAGTIRAALHAGIGVEAGLSSPADASELAGSPFAHR